MAGGGRPRLGRRLACGDHSPVFTCPDSTGKTFEFYSGVTGKPVVLIFAGAQGLAAITEEGVDPAAIDTARTQVVTLVPGDAANAAAEKRAADWPHRTMADRGAEITEGFAGLSGVAAPAVYVLDPCQRVVDIARVDELGNGFGEWVAERVEQATFDVPPSLVERAPPVLIVPRAIDPEDCDWLIGLWHKSPREDGQVSMGSDAGGGSGLMPTTKRREDLIIRDREVEQRLANRLLPRLVPEVSKILHFEGWNMESFRVGCYRAEKAGFFNVHRDDCAPSVRHRKFAVTINLNTGEYEGGDLRFPEYGPELFRPPKGGAIVFSCSMLHEVVPVTSGHRFALLTFLITPPPG